MKVLVATEKPFAAVAVDGIRKVIAESGYELQLLEKYSSKADLLGAVADADAVIIRSDVIDAEVLDAAKRLRIVVRAGAGYDNVDLAAATAHGVVVENTPGQNSNAVAELVFGMAVMAVRNMYKGTSGLMMVWLPTALSLSTPLRSFMPAMTSCRYTFPLLPKPKRASVSTL